MEACHDHHDASVSVQKCGVQMRDFTVTEEDKSLAHQLVDFFFFFFFLHRNWNGSLCPALIYTTGERLGNKKFSGECWVRLEEQSRACNSRARESRSRAGAFRETITLKSLQ